MAVVMVMPVTDGAGRGEEEIREPCYDGNPVWDRERSFLIAMPVLQWPFGALCSRINKTDNRQTARAWYKHPVNYRFRKTCKKPPCILDARLFLHVCRGCVFLFACFIEYSVGLSVSNFGWRRPHLTYKRG